MKPIGLFRLAALVFVAVSFVVFGDTAGKLLTSKGVDPVFVAWSRFAFAAIILLPFSSLSPKELPTMFEWPVFLRTVFIVCGICCILMAFKTEPIANVFGAFFIGPIVSYLLAMLFLGERPSTGRSILLVIGFFGVMLVVKPGFGASIGIVFALLSGVCYGCYLAMTRIVAGRIRPRLLLMSQLVVGALLLTPLGLSAGFPEFDSATVAFIAISALGSATGNYLLVLANRNAEASLIAPLVYSQLFVATIMGGIVFREWPDVYAFSGLALIAFSGFATLWIVQKPLRNV